MPSGKQLSFQHGEVSPQLRFKSSEVSYPTGLGKLRNMYVKRAGGVSNRSGFETLSNHVCQYKIPVPGGSPGIKGFTYWDDISKVWRTLEYYAEPATPSTYMFAIDGTKIDTIKFTSPLPANIKFTPVKDRIIVTPECKSGSPTFIDTNLAVMMDPALPLDLLVGNKSIPFSSPTVDTTLNGDPPCFPASYLITAIMDDGTERFVKARQTTGYDPATWDITTNAPGNKILYPHAQLSMHFKVYFAAGIPVKSFCLYRASGAGGYDSSFYKLVSRVPHNKANMYVELFDYGADDPSFTPPIDTSMMLPPGTQPGHTLTGAVAACYYQQRLVLLMRPEATPAIKSGDCLVSRIGVPDQLRQPLVYSNTSAFTYTIPITDGTPPHAALAMERMINFTRKGVYVIRGGDQGVFSPTTVNPLLISAEGCSLTIEPKMAGSRGYFINATHTKLMAIEFGIDGNLDVFESSEYSDHLINEVPLSQLEVLTGEDDTVYVLRKDGKLVRVTISDEGVHGFSLVETDGYIESIFLGKSKKFWEPWKSLSFNPDLELYHDVLMCYVIRNGVRLLEKLSIRDDMNREAEFFADAYKPFGLRLVFTGAKHGVLAPDDTIATPGMLNVRPAPNYDVGTLQTIWSEATIPSQHLPIYCTPSPFITMYYDVEETDNEGNPYTRTQEIQFEVISNVANSDPGAGIYTKVWTGYFNAPVPAQLQNIAGQALTTVEKQRRQTRWLPKFNKVGGLIIGDNGSPVVGVGNAVGIGGAVSVVGDGEILSSPLNPYKPDPILLEPIIVASVPVPNAVEFTMPTYVSWGYVGVPYTCVFETLDLESQDNRTFTDAKKLINGAGFGFQRTRGGFYGIPNQPLENMVEAQFRQDHNFNYQTENQDDYDEITIPSKWDRPGRVTVKHVDPTPMTILAIYPKGISGE